MPSENEPLLSGRQEAQTHSGKAFHFIKSSRHLLLGSWINVLLVAIPLALIGEISVCTSKQELMQRQLNSWSGLPLPGLRRRSSQLFPLLRLVDVKINVLMSAPR